MLMKILYQPFLWLWASPASLLGLFVGTLSLPGGSRMRIRHGVIECYAGPVRWLLDHLPVPAMAMTLGHVVLGQTAAALDICREHEHVHVRQYERWGPFFIPAYLLASWWLKLAGKNAYLENPFEREAFEYDRRRQLGEMDGLS